MFALYWTCSAARGATRPVSELVLSTVHEVRIYQIKNRKIFKMTSVHVNLLNSLWLLFRVQTYEIPNVAFLISLSSQVI